MRQCATVTASIYLKARLFPWRRLLGSSVLMMTRGVCMMGSAGVYRAATQRERGGGRAEGVIGGDSSLICEVNLNLNYPLYHNKEILSEVEEDLQSAYERRPN